MPREFISARCDFYNDVYRAIITFRARPPSILTSTIISAQNTRRDAPLQSLVGDATTAIFVASKVLS